MDAAAAAAIAFILEAEKRNLGLPAMPREEIRYADGTMEYGSYLIDLEPCETLFSTQGNPIGGYYDPITGKTVACLDTGGYDEYHTAATIRHEIFHGVQEGYGFTSEAWAEESTASLAEHSLDEMRVNHRDRRQTYVGLLDETDECHNCYRAVDFWAFIGKRDGLPLEDVREFLFGGLTESGVDQVFETNQYSDIASLGDAVWLVSNT